MQGAPSVALAKAATPTGSFGRQTMCAKATACPVGSKHLEACGVTTRASTGGQVEPDRTLRAVCEPHIPSRVFSPTHCRWRLSLPPRSGASGFFCLEVTNAHG